MLSVPWHLDAKTLFEDVNEAHWAADEIEYISKNDIANGYSDGTFRPNENVTRGQVAKMIVSALDLPVESSPDIRFQDVDRDDPLYPYIAAVAEEGIMKGSDGEFRPQKELSRAEMAVVLSRAFQLKGESELEFADISKDYWAAPAIQRLVQNGITSGHSDGRFEPGDLTSRAHFSVFLARCLDEKYRVEKINTPSSEVNSEEKAWSFRGVTLGDDAGKVTGLLGEANSIESSRYGFDWHIYHDDYSQFVQYGIREGKVVAIYSNQDTWTSENNLRMNETKEDVIDALGDPLSSIRKGGGNFSVETSSAGTYKQNDQYTTYFYDAHRNHLITGVLIIDKEEEEQFRQFYAEPTKELKESYERQVFYLANAQRKRFDRGLLKWDDLVSSTARSHSAHMAGENFFDHTNPDGEDPFDRMESDGVTFFNAAENIAYGQMSPIYAHHSWMNSKSHRQALLGDYTRLGVGVAFHEIKKQPYYTQNFYTPR